MGALSALLTVVYQLPLASLQRLAVSATDASGNAVSAATLQTYYSSSPGSSCSSNAWALGRNWVIIVAAVGGALLLIDVVLVVLVVMKVRRVCPAMKWNAMH